MILCSGTLGRVPFETKARAAAAAGFTGVSIYAHEATSSTRKLLDLLGLSVAELDGPLAWLPGQPGRPVAGALELAGELGARWLTVLETTGTAPDPGLAADAYADLCDRAVPYGVVPVIEPFAWSGLATVGQAHEIVARAGQGGILLDTWHLLRGPDAGVLPPTAASTVVAVQVSDPAPVPGASLRDECMSGRRLPGPESAFVLRTLPSHVPVEVEVFGLQGAPDEAAVAAYGALRDLHSS